LKYLPMKDYHLAITKQHLSFIENCYIPRTLCHYTNSASGKLIRESKILRAYDLRTMQDKNEFWYGVDLFRSHVKRRKLGIMLDPVCDFIEREIKSQSTMKFFLVCFTASNKETKHWARYGGNYKGNCLEIKKESIKLSSIHHASHPSG
jgi:hypothetical protein